MIGLPKRQFKEIFTKEPEKDGKGELENCSSELIMGKHE
jgi:hypothetical protein